MLSMSQLCGRAVKKVHIALGCFCNWIIPELPDLRWALAASEQPKEGGAWKPCDIWSGKEGAER